MGILAQASVAVQRQTIGAAAAQNAAAFEATFGNVSGRGVAARSRSALLSLYRKHHWVRLAGDVVAARQSSAEWFLLLPRGSGGASAGRRLRAAKAWNRAAIAKAAIAAGDLAEVTDHPYLAMLAAGADGAPMGMDLPGYEVDKLERITLDLMGEMYYLLIRDPQFGFPVRWFPVPPTWIRRPQKGRKYFELVAAPGHPIPVEDVAYYRQPRPDDPYGHGSGLAESLDHELQHDEYAAAYSVSLLRHHSRPDLLVIAPGLGQTQMERFKQEWSESLSGPTRAGMAHFLGYDYPPAGSGRAGVAIKELSHSPADLDMENARKNRRDAILQVWRVPPNVIGATESSNRATAHEAEVFLRRNRTVPDLESRRNWQQTRFFDSRGSTPPEYPGGWIVMYRLPKLKNPETEAALMQAAPYAFPHNAILRAGGQEPVENGDARFFVPDGLRVTTDLDSMPDSFESF